MKKLLGNPTFKKIGRPLAVLFTIFLAPIIMPLMFLGGCFGIWRYSKRKPNTKKRNIAIAVTIIGMLGSYTIDKLNLNYLTNETEKKQVAHFASEPSSKKEDSIPSSTTSSSEKGTVEKEKLEKEKKEQEKKEKEKKEKEKKEKEKKEAEEAKKAEEARKAEQAEQAEQAIQQLEGNQVPENVAPAQAAVEQITDPTAKTNYMHRIELVQNAINVRAQEAQQQQAQQQQAQQAPGFSYRNCREARAAGVAPLYRGQPGYGTHLDRDGDGVACE